MKKIFYATGGANTSSSGFVNYSLGDEATLHRTLSEVWSQLPNAVVIDGDDDWYAPKILHPENIADASSVKILAHFHSGISGLSKSGIIIDKKDLNTFLVATSDLKKKEDWIAQQSKWRRKHLMIHTPKSTSIKLTVL